MGFWNWAGDQVAGRVEDRIQEQQERQQRRDGGKKVRPTKVGTLLTQEQGSTPQDARVDGRLVFRDGCFYVTPSPRAKREGARGKVWPIWPQGFAYRGTERRARIIDQDGQVVAKVGDLIVGSGMVTDDRRVAGDVVRNRGNLSACDGPYWLMGPTVEVRRSPSG